MTIKLTPEGDLVQTTDGLMQFPKPVELATAAELKAAGLQRVGEDEVVVKREQMGDWLAALEGSTQSGARFVFAQIRALLNAEEAHDDSRKEVK